MLIEIHCQSRLLIETQIDGSNKKETIWTTKCGQLVSIIYIQDGKFHRDGGPAMFEWRGDGVDGDDFFMYDDPGEDPDYYWMTIWYYQYGVLHRESSELVQATVNLETNLIKEIKYIRGGVK